MTRAEILAIPADHLPGILLAQGLLPAAISERFVEMGHGYRFWEPHKEIDHAWPLVAMWGLTLAPSRSLGHGSWWAGQRWGDGCFAATFADLPAAICRAVLLCDATRAPFEGGPHAD